jgi:hypothetical protein
MKKLRRRTPSHKVNRKQKALAIKALTSIVQSDDAQPYVKAKAAAALLNGGREPTDDPAFARDPDAPRKLIVLPDKENDPGVRFAIYEENQVVAIIPAGYPADHEVQPEEFYAHVPKPLGVVAENAWRELIGEDRGEQRQIAGAIMRRAKPVADRCLPSGETVEIAHRSRGYGALGAASRKFVLDSFTPVSYPRAMPRQANAAVMSASTILVLARPTTLPVRSRAGLSIGERIVLGTSAVSAFATLAYVVGLVIIIW